MENREPVQVSFQLPAGALEGLSRLVEQLRLLAAEVNGGRTEVPAAPVEQAESSGFDAGRFEALRGALAPPESVPGEVSGMAGAEAVQAAASAAENAEAVQGEALSDVDEPECAGPALEELPQQAAEAAEPPAAREEPEERALPEEAAVPEAQPVRAETADQLEEAAVVQPAAQDRELEAPAVRMEPESAIPDAEAVWAEAKEPPASIASVRTEISSAVEAARSAGFVMTEWAEPGRSRWTGVPEELAAAGPAPLTAESVSLAFRRDGRRYDNGFPLY